MLAAPITAHAVEVGAARTATRDVLALTSDVFAHARTRLPTPTPVAPSEVRLSSGEKTIIIVAAIVVGVLIIVGVAAIGKPGRHLP